MIMQIAIDREITMTRKLLNVTELKEDMLIDEDLFSIFGTLIVPKDTIITKSIIEKLKSNLIKKVYVREIEQETILWDLDISLEERKKQIAQFQKKFIQVQQDLQNMMERVIESGVEINIQEISSTLHELMIQPQNASSLLTMLSHMKSNSKITYTHFLQVAITSRIFATWLNWSKKDIEMVGVAGLFHDIGKCLMDSKLLNKKEKITELEYEQLHQHTILGFDLLVKNKTDKKIALTALCHHEHYDGTGYPTKSSGEDICEYARLIAIVNVFTAMTSDRPYREKISGFEALDYFEHSGFGKYDPRYLLTFLTNVSKSYLHHIVKLNNGKIGEVVFINNRLLSRPIVKVDGEFLDLSILPELRIIDII